MEFFATLDRRRVVTALMALLIAFLTGYVMQNFLADGVPVATIDDAPDAAPLMQLGDTPRPLPTPPAATLTPIMENPPIMPMRTRIGAEPEREARASGGCEMTLGLIPAPASTVRVQLNAPCHGNRIVRVSQGPLSVDGVTDQDGKLSVRMPALSRSTHVKAAVGNQFVEATVEVADASEYQHVAIMWSGPQRLQMHAYEFGARKNQFGHVWSGSPKSPSRAMRGSGGYLTRLGFDTGTSAEIYSFPIATAPVRGVVRLVVEAPVTAGNCDQVIKAKAVQTGPLGRLSSTDIALSVPGCDKVGETIELQNLLQDMRLAGR